MGVGGVESLKGKAYLLKEKVVHEAMAVVRTIHPLGGGTCAGGDNQIYDAPAFPSPLF